MSPMMKATLALELIRFWLISPHLALVVLPPTPYLHRLYRRRMEELKTEVEGIRTTIATRFAPRLAELSRQFEHAKTDALRDKARTARWDVYRTCTGRMLSAISTQSDEIRQLNTAWCDLVWLRKSGAWLRYAAREVVLAPAPDLTHTAFVEEIKGIISSFDEPEHVLRIAVTPVFKDFGRDSIRFFATYPDGGYSVMLPIDLPREEVEVLIASKFQGYREAVAQEAALEVQHVGM